MKSRNAILSITAICAFTAGLLSAQRERFDHEVRADFFAGFSGDKEALERGMKKCEEILAVNPKHAEALVWHGAGTYFSAGHAFRSGDREKGMELAQRGMKEMDEAAALEPDSIGVRIPRGAAYFTATRNMPPQVARPLIEKAVSDYSHVEDMQKAYFEQLGTHPRGELLFGLADGYARLGDEEKARSYFERMQKELPESAYAKRAATWLATKSLPANQTGCIGCHTGK